MTMQLRIIQNEAEHQQALARLAELMEQDPPAESPESDELDVLAVLIEDFETKHFPIDPPDPVDAIEFRMDQMGLTRKDLVPYIGSQSKVSEVLNRKRPLSLSMIRRLSEGLGISADVLIREPAQVLADGADSESGHDRDPDQRRGLRA
jgi:HTH-type transcriptional regulator / antitoxin HigA